MEYRDQLKYIKSLQEEEIETGRIKQRKAKKRMRKKPRRIGFVSHFLWFVQLAATVGFFWVMKRLGIFPVLYMLAFGLLFLLLLLLVKAMQRQARRSRKKRSTGKGISILVSAVLIVASLYGMKVNAALDKIAVGDATGKGKKAQAAVVTDHAFNVYISGIDVYGDLDQESRSDVNLIATVNPTTHQILLTTTPRDYYVTIPGVSGEEKDKLTHAGNYGVETSMATLENLYDTDIDFYVRVNFTSVEEIVDILGGVDVKSDVSFKTSKAAGKVVKVKKGMNHFNGKEALAFVRERKALATGDNQRGKHQQALLTALLHKTMSPKIALNGYQMINSVAGNADTNLSEDQIKSLIRMQLSDMKKWEIESVAAEGNDTGKHYCYSYRGGPLYVTVPYENSVNEIKSKIKGVLTAQ